MVKKSPDNRKLVKVLNTQIKKLQTELVEKRKLEGKDLHISVAVKKNQARFKRVKQKGAPDKVFGMFYLEISITAKQTEVYVPLSIASGKKTAGFMYQIEGEGEGSIVTTDLKVSGAEVERITIGTLQFAKIPTGKTGLFSINTTIKGKSGKAYRVVFSRLNYKLQLSDARYQQYLKALRSKRVTFS